MANPQWNEEVQQLIRAAKEDLENALGVPSYMATQLQYRAVKALMQAVEIHNDNFRFKVDSHGTKISR